MFIVGVSCCPSHPCGSPCHELLMDVEGKVSFRTLCDLCLSKCRKLLHHSTLHLIISVVCGGGGTRDEQHKGWCLFLTLPSLLQNSADGGLKQYVSQLRVWETSGANPASDCAFLSTSPIHLTVDTIVHTV